MIVANGQMGTINMAKIGYFIPNSFPNLSSSNGFSISQKPHFRHALKDDVKKTKPIWVFYVQRTNSRVVSALAKGESLNQSINNGFLEDEFKFEPAFNEYVKAMESVRDNNLGRNVDEYFKKSSTRKNFLNSSIERDKSGEDEKIGNWDRGSQNPNEFLEKTSQSTLQNPSRGELGYRGSDRNLIDITGLGMHENGNDVKSNRTKHNFVDGSSDKGSRGSGRRLGSGKSGRRETDRDSRGKTGSGMYRKLNDAKGDKSNGHSKTRKLYPKNYSGVQKNMQINGGWTKYGVSTAERKVGGSGVSGGTSGAKGRESYEKFSIDKRSRGNENLGVGNANLERIQNKRLQQNGIWGDDQVNDLEIEMDKPGTNRSTVGRDTFYRINVERNMGEHGINRNNVGRKIGMSKVNKNMSGTESFYGGNIGRKTGEAESITRTLERRMLDGSKAGTKTWEYDIKKNISERGVYKRRVDGSIQENILRSGEARMGEIESKEEERDMHATDLERTDNYRGGISLRWASYDARAEIHEQNKSEREARLIGDSVGKEKETISTMVGIRHGGSSSRQNSYDTRVGTHERNRRQQYVGLHGDTVKTEKQGPRSTEMHGNYIRTEEGALYKVSLRREEQRPSQVFVEDVDGSALEMERAAFKSYEVFTDVRGKPRVLRMEMEERIQMLAKGLNGADINMPEWQFSKMIHSAKIRFTDHSILRTVQILGAFGNWRRALQIVEWLQSHERFTSYKSRYIYTTVLNVLGKAKRPVEALNVFYVMRKQLSSYPDLAAYHCIAVTLGQAGYMKELFDVIDLMRALPEKKFKLGLLEKWDPRLEPDLVVYNAVLNACVRRKQWEGAFWVLQQLKQQGINPSTTTYGLVMEVMLACDKYNLVHEFFRKVEKNSIPNAMNYKVLLNTLWREGKPDEAVLVVEDMEKRGIVGSASLYYDLARCLCSFGRCQEALLQIDKICKVAKKPLVVTYTGLIQACLDSGSVQNGTYIFNQMHKFCSPNLVTYNIMLKSYVENGMFEEAKDLFQKILDGSHYITTTDSREKVAPDKFTFNTMLEACFTKQRWDDFEDVYQQMLRNRYHFDAKRHLRMILEASRAGKGQSLDVTWDHLVQSGRVVPTPIIKERFCMKLQEDDCAAAISIISCLQMNAMHAFSEKSWLDLFKANDYRLQKGILVRLIREVSTLISNSDRPDPTFQNLLTSCRLIINNHVPLTTINLQKFENTSI